jgi:hypothetical protein
MGFICTFTASFVYGINDISTFIVFSSVYSNLNLYLSSLPTTIT